MGERTAGCEVSEVFTGLVAETKDERWVWRDRQIDLPPMAGEVREQLFDSPPSWVRIEAQGQTNSCAAHAGTSCAERVAYAKSGTVEQLSRNYLYVRGQEKCGLFGRDVGCTLGGIISALTEFGVCPETLWPFTGTYQTQIPRGCDDQAKRYRATHTVDVESLGYEGFRTVIGQNIGAVLMATSWPLRLWDGYIVEQHQPTGRGGHALAGLFLSSRLDGNGRPYVWVANSHDVTSGKAGWLLWSPRAIDSLIQSSQWGCTGLTDMSTPAPREVDWRGTQNPFLK